MGGCRDRDRGTGLLGGSFKKKKISVEPQNLSLWPPMMAGESNIMLGYHARLSCKSGA